MEMMQPLLGHWVWWIIAGLLLIGEMFLPGFFLLWLAMAAALTGIFDLIFHMPWQADVAAFCASSALLVAASWKFVARQRNTASDQPHLNNRVQSYIGRNFTLEHPVTHGTGKLRIDDTLWDIEGPDLPKGARITIIAVEGFRLKFEAQT
jgi:membrane protein implicated in regulation of membrane protease activity